MAAHDMISPDPSAATRGERRFRALARQLCWLTLAGCAATRTAQPPPRTTTTRAVEPGLGAPSPLRRCELASAVPDDGIARSAEAYAGALQQAWDVSGVLLVERRGAILLERAFGLASRETGTPVTVDTQFAIGSVTKEWTAWLVRDAALAGSLPLDSRLARWLPDLPIWKDVTIQQLLDHRAGLVRTADGLREARSPAEATQRCAGAPLLFAPGSDHAYSNCGYDVLARVLELATGHSFPDLLRERLLGPRDMHDSGLGAAPRLARGYTRENGKTVPAGALRSSGGAGGGYSTARDLCQFLLARQEQEENAQPAAAPAVSGNGRSAVHGQAGKTDGFSSFVVSDGKTQTGIVYLTNQEGAPASRVFEDLEKIVAGQPAEAPRQELRRVIAGDRQQEDWLLGTFQLEVDASQRMTIERRGQKLVFIDPGGQVSGLVWVGPRLLVLVSLDEARPEVSSDAELAFPKLDGPASHIELHILGGMRLKATRVRVPS